MDKEVVNWIRVLDPMAFTQYSDQWIWDGWKAGGERLIANAYCTFPQSVIGQANTLKDVRALVLTYCRARQGTDPTAMSELCALQKAAGYFQEEQDAVNELARLGQEMEKAPMASYPQVQEMANGSMSNNIYSSGPAIKAKAKLPRVVHVFLLRRGRETFCSNCGIAGSDYRDKLMMKGNCPCRKRDQAEVMADVEGWIFNHTNHNPLRTTRLGLAEKGHPIGERVAIKHFPRRYGDVVNEWQLRGPR